MFRLYLSILFVLFVHCDLFGQPKGVTLINVDSGWAKNSINTVIFRSSPLVTHNESQYIAYYDEQKFVVLGKRKSGQPKWQLMRTSFKGNTLDAHNCISMAIDGKGFLHMAWDHHNNKLNYCKSKRPGSLEMTDKVSMTGANEQSVSYPQFYKLPNGDLLFFYRDGASGRGNLVLNRYNVNEGIWTQLHSNLIDGEGQRNAYWQSCIDSKGVVHLSWVWRESPDVASNHDMCYARSTDGGATWTRSDGSAYQLPVNATTAEYAYRIPEKSELINQTAMFADPLGRVFIASYWKGTGDAVPQYHLIMLKDGSWKSFSLGFRKTGFSLSGGGTKRIPISRPQIIAWDRGKNLNIGLIFRDEERNNKVSVAMCKDINKGKWEIIDLTNESVGSWEPTYDVELWKKKRILNLFVQHVEQADAEGITAIGPQMIRVLEWKP